MDACPCGSGAAYTECCEPPILGHRPAETPEALMRSRYSAYALKKTDYVYDTTHPDQRQPDSRQVIQDWAATTEWHRLEILDRQGGGPDDGEGTVEFIAEYTEKGKRGTHHEIAEFQRLDGRWYFRDGRAPKIRQVVRSTPKVGRNDPCPCGSGKKYKKCCLA